AARKTACWGANRARIAVASRTRPDSARHDQDLPMTWSMLVRGHLCCVAGQGFEPWKASADGFTVRSHWPLGQPAWWPDAPAAGHDTQSVTSSGNGPGEYGRHGRARKERARWQIRRSMWSAR